MRKLSISSGESPKPAAEGEASESRSVRRHRPSYCDIIVASAALCRGGEMGGGGGGDLA